MTVINPPPGHQVPPQTDPPEDGQGAQFNAACPKCGHTRHRSEIIRTTGDDWSRYFNLQNQRFRARICEQCGYTELFSMKSDWGDNFLDLLFGS